MDVIFYVMCAIIIGLVVVIIVLWTELRTERDSHGFDKRLLARIADEKKNRYTSAQQNPHMKSRLNESAQVFLVPLKPFDQDAL